MRKKAASALRRMRLVERRNLLLRRRGSFRILDRHFLEQVVCMVDFFHDPQHVADIEVDHERSRPCRQLAQGNDDQVSESCHGGEEVSFDAQQAASAAGPMRLFCAWPTSLSSINMPASTMVSMV